jgi:hypothetical protein
MEEAGVPGENQRPWYLTFIFNLNTEVVICIKESRRAKPFSEYYIV